MKTILDCYTDEPSGLGVPPYLGTYPRYIYGALEDATYLTIDDLRLYKHFNLKIPIPKPSQKSNIKVHNLTKNYQNVEKILNKTTELIVILGIHTPGKYLSAVPGTLKEVIELIKEYPCKKVLTGPGVYGSQGMGGKFAERVNLDIFDSIDENYLNINNYKKINAKKGASLINQISDLRIVEIETSKGCNSGKCSFCTEPLKHSLEFRDPADILEEIKEFYKLNVRHFRLGKQSCFYSYPEVEKLLKAINENCPSIKVLHIDNVNPINVTEKITKSIVQYCTSGNIAAFGVESFDKEVIKQNKLNSNPEITLKAVEIINKYGATRGSNGLPKFLPGINLLLGLIGESKNTFEENLIHLKKITNNNLIRRINIRQVAIFENTPIAEIGNKYIKKNKKHYFRFKKNVREQIDYPMLKKITPKETILKDVRTEIYNGKTTFGRQIGTYPLIVGIKGRVPLNEFVNIKVTNHMLRSIVGEIVSIIN